MGTVIPSPARLQVGSRHQFTWNATIPEVGVFTLPDPYPTPPTLTGPGVIVCGLGFSDVTDPVPAAVPVTLDLYRGSDGFTATIPFAAGPHTVGSIMAAINAAFPAPDFAYPSRISDNDRRITLVDKDSGGGAEIRVLLDLTNTTNAKATTDFLGFMWGSRSTTPVTVFQMMHRIPNVLDVGEVSNDFVVPDGADAVSVLFRYSSQPGVTGGFFALWSDGLAPFDGLTGSMNLNSATGLTGIRTVFDYGVGELELYPQKDAQSQYPLDWSTSFHLRQIPGLPGYLIDPGFYSGEAILDRWQNNQVTLRPPPGMKRLRLMPAFINIDPAVIPTGGWPFGPRIQAYAWASSGV